MKEEYYFEGSKKRLGIWFTCQRCGKEFLRRKTEIINNRKYYCSNDCHNLDQKESRYTESGKWCNRCGLVRPIVDFFKRSDSQGLRSICKFCYSPRTRPLLPEADQYGKYCTVCLVYKTYDYFYKNCKSRDGKTPSCKECINTNPKRKITNQRASEHRKQHLDFYHEVARRQHLQRKFGLTLDAYDRMKEEQNGVCAICRCAESKMWNGKIMELSVDHSHKTNTIRGLLCDRCNTSIGKFKDDVDLLLSAVEYLRKTEKL